MKVRVWVEQEVEADVSLDDVMDELGSLPPPEIGHETLRLLSLCLGGIKRVPDKCLAALTPEQRAILTTAMEAQLARYSAAPSDQQGGRT